MTRLTPAQKKIKKKRIIFWSFFFLVLSTFILISFFQLSKYLRSSFYNKISRSTFLFTVNNSNHAAVISFEEGKGIEFIIELDKGIGNINEKNLDSYFHRNNLFPVFGYFFDVGPKQIEDSKKNPKILLERSIILSILGKQRSTLKRNDLLNLLIKTFFTKKNAFLYKHPNDLPEDFFKDKKIRDEQASIVVLNSTEKTGLALNIAIFLENSGGRVVRISDWTDKKIGCEILINEKFDSKSSYTVEWLKNYYHCPVINNPFEEKRADITVIFGEGF